MSLELNNGMEEATRETRYVVTFVHGTWGRKSSFLRTDSPLVTSLRKHVAKLTNAVKFTFVTFRWSGSNRVSARLRAATQLGRHIKRKDKQYPHARQYIVAHSHGGNVALYALKDPEIDSIVDGVICFSTPFVNVSWRNEKATLSYSTALKIVVGAPLSVLLFGVLSAALYLMSRIEPLADAVYSAAEFMVGGSDFGPPVGAIVMAVAVGVMLTALLAMWLLYLPLKIVNPFVDSWLNLAGQHEKRLRVPVLQDDRLLIIRAIADEASSAIALTGFITWMTSAVFEIFFQLAVVPIIRITSYDLKFRHPVLILFYGIATLISLALLLLASFVVSIPLFILLMLGTLTGLAYPSTSIFLRSGAESCPLGDHRVYLYDTGSDPGRMAHSASYLHQPAVDNAVRWILQSDQTGANGH